MMRKFVHLILFGLIQDLILEVFMCFYFMFLLCGWKNFYSFSFEEEFPQSPHFLEILSEISCFFSYMLTVTFSYVSEKQFNY